MTHEPILLCGDSFEIVAGLEPESIDACATDPPYGLGFMNKRWDTPARGAFGYQKWTEGWAREVFRVLKPGAHMLVFGGSRTAHRLTAGIEDAGFEIRDSIDWLYGSGFPKSVDAEREIARAQCTETGRHFLRKLPLEPQPGDHVCAETAESRGFLGVGSALKPAKEPIILARKPVVLTLGKTLLRYGTGGLHVDRCRVEIAPEDAAMLNSMGGYGNAGYRAAPGVALNISVQPPIKPATFEAHENGRWPANVILDTLASEELDRQAAAFASAADATTSGVSRFFYCPKPDRGERDLGLDAFAVRSGGELTGRKDGAAGTKHARAGAGHMKGGRNTHPTVKPLALMRWLVRLITAPGQTVIDPFMGSGTTGMAAKLEFVRFVGIDLEPEYVEIAKARIAAAEPPALLKLAEAGRQEEAEQSALFGDPATAEV